MGYNFLIVSSELALRIILIDLIEKLDLKKFSITEADGILGAYLELKSNVKSVNCVIVDWHIPFGGGLELTKNIRESTDLNIKDDTPIIALIENGESPVEAISAGVNCCLEIFLSQEELKEKIDEVTKKEKVFNS